MESVDNRNAEHRATVKRMTRREVKRDDDGGDDNHYNDNDNEQRAMSREKTTQLPGHKHIRGSDWTVTEVSLPRLMISTRDFGFLSTLCCLLLNWISSISHPRQLTTNKEDSGRERERDYTKVSGPILSCKCQPNQPKSSCSCLPRESKEASVQSIWKVSICSTSMDGNSKTATSGCRLGFWRFGLRVARWLVKFGLVVSPV